MGTHKVNIKVGTKGADKAAKSLGKADRGIQGMAKSALKFGAVYFSARGLGAALKNAIELAGEQELAEKKLSTALGYTSRDLLNQASALQQVTTYGDEAIIAAQSLIAAFVDDEDQIKAATEATLDLAAAKGMDLNAAADLVSKTLGSSTNAMSRYGIEVEGAVGSSERLESLTDSVADKFGGQAAAAADTMTGKMTQAKNAIGDTAEAIGTALIPAIDPLLTKFKLLAEEASGAEGSFDSMSEAAFYTGHSLGIVVDILHMGVVVVAGLEKALISVAAVAVNAGQVIWDAMQFDFANMRRNWGELTDHIGFGGQAMEDMFTTLADLDRSAGQHIASMEYGWRGYKKTVEDANDAGDDAGDDGLDLVAQAEKEKARVMLEGWQAQRDGYQAHRDWMVEQYEALGEDEYVAKAQQQIRIAELDEQEKERQQEALDSAVQELEVRSAMMDLMPDIIASQGELVEVQGEQKDILDDLAISWGEYVGLAVSGADKMSASLAGSLGTAAAEWKEFGLAAKRMSQVQALIDTYGAATAAYKAMAGIPVVGPALGAAAAAAAVVAGLANVRQIEAQQFARGGDFVTAGPQMIMVGDNPGGQERVQVTPLSSPNFDGPQGNVVNVNFNAPVSDEVFIRDKVMPAISKAQRLA